METFLGLSPSAWVAVLTVVLAIIAFFQVRIYHQIHATTERAERAYVNMSHKPPGLVCFKVGLAIGPEPVPIGPNAMIGVEVQITNHGRTPANVLAAVLTLHVGTELPNEPPYTDNPEWGAFFLMPNEGHFFVTPILSTPLTDEQFLSIQEGRLKMWALGYVDYTDIFEAHHRAGYARRYEPMRTDNNLVFETKPGYNYDKTK